MNEKIKTILTWKKAEDIDTDVLAAVCATFDVFCKTEKSKKTVDYYGNDYKGQGGQGHPYIQFTETKRTYLEIKVKGVGINSVVLSEKSSSTKGPIYRS